MVPWPLKMMIHFNIVFTKGTDSTLWFHFFVLTLWFFINTFFFFCKNVSPLAKRILCNSHTKVLRAVGVWVSRYPMQAAIRDFQRSPSCSGERSRSREAQNLIPAPHRTLHPQLCLPRLILTQIHLSLEKMMVFCSIQIYSALILNFFNVI